MMVVGKEKKLKGKLLIVCNTYGKKYKCKFMFALNIRLKEKTS